ncbi:unnamed protein product [Rhizophagus irregularis]|nr:unnamed protein product [Rhizophagus irregularis]CAB5377527.1 unnamed protein product [Rhizophagus irregularis]
MEKAEYLTLKKKQLDEKFRKKAAVTASDKKEKRDSASKIVANKAKNSEDDVYVKEGKKRMLEEQGERSNSEYEETEHGIRPVAHSGRKGGKPGSRMGKRKKGKGKK